MRRGQGRGGYAGTVLAAAMAASLLWGCASETATLPGLTGATSAAVADASGDAAAGGGGEPFTPFAPEGTTDRPAREVIANPSLAEVQQAGPLPEFSLGRADAPVVMVKYMSLTCPHCRRFMADTFPTLKRDYIDTGKVRFVIREFPIGKTSGNATIALRCAPMAKYLTLYQKFLEQQATWVSQEVRPEAIHRIAAQVGLSRADYDACVGNAALVDGLKAVKERGRQLGIIGTPNFFVANRLVKSQMGMAEIRAIVDPMLAGRTASAASQGG